MIRVAHFDTSKLDDIIASIVEQQVNEYTVADGMTYGLFVELGTSRMGARPYLIPAFEQNTRNIEAALGQAIERGVPLNPVLSKTAFDIQRDAQQAVAVDTGALKNSLHVEEQ